MSVNRVTSKYEASDVEIDGRGTFVKIIKDEDSSRAHLIPRDTYDGLVGVIRDTRGIAINSLKNFPGYLHANDREDMRVYLETGDVELIGEAKFTESRGDIGGIKKEFGKALSRASYLGEKGVPPIFSKEFESSHEWSDEEGNKYHKFPTVDTIINLVTRETRPDRFMGRWGYSNKVRLENIERFSQDLARVDSGALWEQLVQEIDRLYIFKDEYTRSYVVGKARDAFEHLRVKLAGFKSGGKVSTYDSSVDSFGDIMKTPFWFTQFEKSSVEAIMKDYWEDFVSKGLDSDTPFSEQIEGVERIVRIFPEYVPRNVPEIEKQRIDLMHERRDLEARAMDESGDFGKLTEKFYETSSKDTVTFIREAIGKRMLGQTEFGSLRTNDQLRKTLGMSGSDKSINFYETLFCDAAIYAIKSMDLEDFCNFVGGVNQKVAGSTFFIPYVQERISSDKFKEEFTNYWGERMTDEVFVLPPAQIRQAMNVNKDRFRRVVDSLIEVMGLAYVEGLSDESVVEVVNKRPHLKHRPKTELALAERVDNLIGERVRAGESINKVMGEFGFTHIPDSFKRLLEGQPIRLEPKFNRRYW